MNSLQYGKYRQDKTNYLSEVALCSREEGAVSDREERGDGIIAEPEAGPDPDPDELITMAPLLSLSAGVRLNMGIDDDDFLRWRLKLLKYIYKRK